MNKCFVKTSVYKHNVSKQTYGNTFSTLDADPYYKVVKMMVVKEFELGWTGIDGFNN